MGKKPLPFAVNDHTSGGFEVTVVYATSLPPPSREELESMMRAAQARRRRDGFYSAS